MLRLLAFLWSGCWHKWVTVETGRLQLYSGGRPENHTGLWWAERCERCGVNRYRKEW